MCKRASKPGDGSELIDAYVLNIRVTFFNLSDADQSSARGKKVNELLESATNNSLPTRDRWSKIYMAEQLIAFFLPLEHLKAEGDRRLLEAKTLGLRSADEFANKWKDASKNQTKEEYYFLYFTLLDELHWFYNKRSLDRKLRVGVSAAMFLRTISTLALCASPLIILVYSAIIVGALGVSAGSLKIACAILAGLSFGALGAIFSRITSFQQRFASIDYDEASNSFMSRSLNLRQAIGSVGAIVFLAAAAAQLVEGTLFPSYDNVINLKADDWAKLVVWSFVAGFSERLVPDLLSRTEAANTSLAAQEKGKGPPV